MGNEHSGNSQRGVGSRDSPRSPLSPTSAAVSASLTRQYEQLSLGGRHESVASDGDSEVPYVSYTVNKPIGGDSPKKKQGRGASAKVKAKSSFRLKDSGHNTMVTVSSGSNGGKVDRVDPEVERLSQIPSFLPIMRASLSGSAAKDPDILERLDYRGLLSMAERYQIYLGNNAAVISANQAELGKTIKEVDQMVAKVTQGLAERQKVLAQHQQKFKQVDEMSKCLAKCQLLLNENIEQMEVLNSMLPIEERLEPFVWTTG